jgi:excisionase family DNA binding protein
MKTTTPKEDQAEDRHQRRAQKTADRLGYRVDEFAESIGVSLATVYRKIDAGELRTVRFGKAVIVPAAEAARVMSEGL